MPTDATDTLIARYRGVICDLDGVVYRGTNPVPGAIETLNRLGAEDVPVVFATNNASRSPVVVADHLRELGLAAAGWSVVNSSQAAAAHLANELPSGTHVFAVGGPGVADALHEAGLVPVRFPELNGHVDAVVQGLGVDVTWSELAEIGYRVEAGARWVATNLDRMLPTTRGRAPGNGALVAAVRTATNVRPHVVGKPAPALFDLARARLGTDQADTLACGDRLDTDIAGANAAGVDSLFVLSGASRLHDVAFAPPAERPTYLAPDLTGMLEPCRRLRVAADPLVDIDADGVPHVVDATQHALAPLVGAVWAALDAGTPVSSETAVWQRLERRFGL